MTTTSVSNTETITLFEVRPAPIPAEMQDWTSEQPIDSEIYCFE